MVRITINIDTSDFLTAGEGVRKYIDDVEEETSFEVEDEENIFVCPLSTQSIQLNSENREEAIEDYSYDFSSGSKSCGNCEYFNIRSEMMDCIEKGLDLTDSVGYCEKLDFTCDSEKVCDAWEEGGPISDSDSVIEEDISDGD